MDKIQTAGLMPMFSGIGALFTLLLLFMVIQKVKYDRWIKELVSKHKEQVRTIREMTYRPVSFDKDFMSYEHYSKLPSFGQDNTLYFIRSTGQHYFWDVNGYKGIRFESFEDSLPRQELEIKYSDGTSITYIATCYEKGEFCFAKFMKWYLCAKTEYFEYKLTDGFDIINRSNIKRVSYRSK